MQSHWHSPACLRRMPAEPGFPLFGTLQAQACVMSNDATAAAQGLVLPPRVAHTQVVIIPIVNAKMSAEEKSAMYQRAAELLQSLRQAGVKVQSDTRENYTPGWKYSHWELMVRPMYCRTCSACVHARALCCA